jgi:hypothetical protein
LLCDCYTWRCGRGREKADKYTRIRMKGSWVYTA